jgi:hypothetical protein
MFVHAVILRLHNTTTTSTLGKLDPTLDTCWYGTTTYHYHQLRVSTTLLVPVPTWYWEWYGGPKRKNRQEITTQ